VWGTRWGGARGGDPPGPPRPGPPPPTPVPGLSDRLLSRRLRELEEEGLVQREVEAGTPTRVVYSLTDKGDALGPAIKELQVWARSWK
jgi:DNA-binding HxlR family transcriptional regulator